MKIGIKLIAWDKNINQTSEYETYSIDIGFSIFSLKIILVSHDFEF